MDPVSFSDEPMTDDPITMSYDFSFDKKSLLLILGGSVAIGILLFFAGFIVGWDRGKYAARLTLKDEDTAKTVQKQPPADNRSAGAASVVAPAPQTKPAAAPSEENKAPAAPDTKPEKPVSTAASASQLETPSPSGSQTKPAARAAPEKSSPSEPASSAGESADAAADQSSFSLQLGAFQNENNALRLKNDMKSRGYPVFVFNTLDAGGRVWHTVRIGRYSDMKKALEAATTFAEKEKIPVFVRPLNEL